MLTLTTEGFLVFKVKLQLTPDDRIRAVIYPARQAIQPDSDENSPPLVNKLKLETLPKSESVRVGWGELSERDTGFSRYGRRVLQCALGLMDKVLPREEILFITLTVPGGTTAAFRAIAANSSRLVHNFKAWINKRIPSKLDAYVWEYQKRGALHLHYVLHCPNKESREYIETNCQSQWIRQLDRLSEETGVDVYEKLDGSSWKHCKSVVRVAVETVKKSVSRYMSKYLSKSVRSGSNGSNFPHPARYYGVSRALHEAVAQRSPSISLYCSENSAKSARVLEQLKHWLESVTIGKVIRSSPFPMVDALCCSIDANDYDSIESSLSQINNLRELNRMLNGEDMTPQNPHLSPLLAYCDESHAVALQSIAVIKRTEWLNRRFELNASQPSIETFIRTQNGKRSSASDYYAMFNDICYAICGDGLGYSGSNPAIASVLSSCQIQMRAYRQLPGV